MQTMSTNVQVIMEMTPRMLRPWRVANQKDRADNTHPAGQCEAMPDDISTDCVIEDDRWETLGLEALAERAVSAALTWHGIGGEIGRAHV